MTKFEIEYKKQLITELNNYEAHDEEEIKAKRDILEFLDNNDSILGKNNTDGHITSAAWIVNHNRSKVILTHHMSLNMWIQLGGHTDDDESAYDAALREGYEESGLFKIEEVDKNIFDLAVHRFPERGTTKAHYHYDIRYLFEADEGLELSVSSESKDVEWVDFGDIETLTDEPAMRRMMLKSL